jgi:hypothetical protein
MSGINKVKEKAKLSIDDMYEDLHAEKPKIEAGKAPEQLTGKPATHLNGSEESHRAIVPQYEASKSTQNHIDQMEINQESYKDEPVNAQTEMISITKQRQKEPTFKMTFNLSPNIYRDFNLLYATRLLEGRKSEKSEMICEAIQLLLKNENEKHLNRKHPLA